MAESFLKSGAGLRLAEDVELAFGDGNLGKKCTCKVVVFIAVLLSLGRVGDFIFGHV